VASTGPHGRRLPPTGSKMSQRGPHRAGRPAFWPPPPPAPAAPAGR
jgi:hypothetical protein